ncbi:MAG: FGGY-family carbohydrate kinase [Bryobacteraceae bacterium]
MSEPSTFLAFDLGAESGRAVLGRFQNGYLETEEVHRFANEPVHYNGGLHWDAPRLWLEIRRSLEQVSRSGLRRLSGIGVDTWGLDFALLGEGGALLDNPYHYRDARADGMVDEVCSIVPADEIYSETGIQFMQINSLYHLYAAAKRSPRLLASAEKLLTIPDLLNYWLTGRAVCEYTNATTTQFLSARSRQWACGLLQRLGIPTHFLAEVVEPASEIGPLLQSLSNECGLSPAPVFAPACHDTGSAVAAIAMGPRSAYISSGTWSLLGTEVPHPVITPMARKMNFTNEGGVGGTIRLLKNITGMWLLHGCKKAWEAAGLQFDYADLVEHATQARPLQSLVDPDHRNFLRPANMLQAIDEFCRRTQQPKPDGPGAYARCVLDSLALKYRYVLDALESVTGASYDEVRVVGGGARNRLLNQLTADATNRRTVAGPAEATALGNLAVQLLAAGCVGSLAEARGVIDRSLPTQTFEPANAVPYEEAYLRFRQYCEQVF